MSGMIVSIICEIMKKEILERYERNDAGELILVISVDKVSDLYNDFDRCTPYSKKELDQDIVDYITESISEIGNEKFVIQFALRDLPSADLQVRLTASIDNYFRYRHGLESRKWLGMKQSSLILLLIGVFMLLVSLWLNQYETMTETVMGHVFSEGTTIAAWVSLWNAMATFLINWPPHIRKLKLYERIASAKILFMGRIDIGA